MKCSEINWIALVLAMALLSTGCVDPKERRPGLRLSGDVVTEAVQNWAFTNDHREIYVEVTTPYLLPHSVTIVCAEVDGRLYIGARNPTEKRWVGYLESDPNVRLKIGDKVYELEVEVVDDAAEEERVFAAYAKKYEWHASPEHEQPEMRYYRVLPRTS